MTLTQGDRIGPYQISSLIGTGGMGEVYRARDGKLNRDVALKVLPELFAADPDRLARFKREAQVLASLNTPNIAAIYGFEDSGAVHALVLELVEGPTLADRIAQGSLPLDEALHVARQIADALQGAHDSGVIHRDLKPANIKVRPDGTVKVLDFGLAKAFEGDTVVAGAGLASMSPTITSPAATRLGTILGTAAYMSPEQARGKAVDKRSDIWAFGCVLYEMLTGRRVFGGDEVSDVLAFVLTQQPEWSALPANTPEVIRKLLRRCLEKDRTRRLADASDARLDIEEGMAAPEHTGAAQSASTRRSPTARTAWALTVASATLAAMSLGVAAWLYLGRTPADASVYRFPVALPDSETWEGTTARVSPDGTKVAYLARGADSRRLIWVHHLDTSVSQPLNGTDDANFPFWSPDSRSLGFSTGRSLKRVDASGGPAITLSSDVESYAGGSWSSAGEIVFSNRNQLFRVNASGGSAVALKAPNRGAKVPALSWPVFLPDGQHFLYLDAGGGDTDREIGIYVASLASDDPKLVVRAISNVAYAAGQILFLRETTLMAQPFDVNRLETTGDAVPVAEGVQVSGSGAALRGVFWASDRVLTYRVGQLRAPSQLVWFDRSGKRVGVLGDMAAYGDVELSADGRHASVSVIDPSGMARDIWVFDVERNLRTRLTFEPRDELASVWSPDGSRLAFNSGRRGHLDLYSKPSSGAADDEVLFEDTAQKWPTSWSPDGRFLLYHTDDRSTGAGVSRYDLFVLPLFGERKPIPFVQTQFTEYVGQFSPDGRWVAYVSNESGRSELYVTPFPRSGGKWQVSTAGSTAQYRWGGDGKEIFYADPGNRLMAAAVNGNGSSFDVGKVAALFDVAFAGPRLAFDVSPDGQRFLINTPSEQQTASPMTVIVNWAAALKN